MTPRTSTDQEQRKRQADPEDVPSSCSRPPLSFAVYLVLVLAVLVFDALDGGLTASALGGAAIWGTLALGVFWHLRPAWMVLIVLHCGNVVFLSGRGEWWQAAFNLVLIGLLVSRPTRNYVARHESRSRSRVDVHAHA